MNTQTPILLTGATGQVGGELLKLLPHLADTVAPPRSKMDLADPGSVRQAIRELKPRWIVNPAAYTAVDKAESEPALARTINCDSVQIIGEEARKIGAAVIHFSTDYVFDGAGTRPYIETDPANPASVYGSTKLAGEQALAQTGAAHVIFRTSWVYGSTGKNFLLTILKLARERDHLRIVGDQHGAPTWSSDLARMVAHLIAQTEAAAAAAPNPQALIGTTAAAPLPEALTDITGIYHASNSGETTWHGFASEAIRLLHTREPQTRFATLEAIATADYPTPAKRPPNSRLNCTKLANRLHWTMPHWKDSLQQVIAAL